MDNELVYRFGLTRINGIGVVQAKQLVEHFGSATAIFTASKKELSSVEGIGELKAKAIKEMNDFTWAESEIAFCKKHHIEPLFLTDERYPKRLLNCYDAPTILFYRGTADLNNSKVISIIGTRVNTEYGKQITEQIVNGLQAQNALIVSGMAFGIDAIAHKAALQNQLETVGVLAHGLDTIYPGQHKVLAKEMLQMGGLLTEFPSKTLPDKHNFPKRNRIVAGMADATIVIETAAKGGSMITAELAYNYNRDLFAIPGKINDAKSSGCLKLIQQKKATIYLTVEQLLEELGWQTKKVSPKRQKELFIELNDDEKALTTILMKSNDSVHIDELYLQSGLSSSSVAAAILNLELQNVIACLPGKRYKMV